MQATIKEVIDLTWPTIVIVVTILSVMRITMLFKADHKKFVLHEDLVGLIFVAYLMTLFRLVTSQELPGGGINLIPFKEILRYNIGTHNFYVQVLGNILLFAPLGFFMTKYCRLKKVWGIILTSTISSLTIEITQHFIGRSFDIDDVILNVFGAVIGYYIYKLVQKISYKLPKFMRSDWFLNIISILIIIAGILGIIKLF